MKTNSFVTNDGVRLNYLEAGSGRPLVMIPGGSQTAAQFKYQLDGLSENYRVIALDMRGHGDSEKPGHGYHIHRLSKDVYDFLAGSGLSDVTLSGHSLGCGVIWGYWELFGSEYLERLILIDQPPFFLTNPRWSEQETIDSGAFLDGSDLIEWVNSWVTSSDNPDPYKLVENFVKYWFTPAYPHDELKWVIEQNLKMPRELMARLVLSCATNDWRQIIPRINIPTLVIGGKSIFREESLRWIASQITDSQVVIFDENEGGSHFMFMENPHKFNSIVSEFMG